LHLPDDMEATGFAINSMSSEGFLVLNPGHIDPGFQGPLSVKAVNLQKAPISINRGDAVFTVIFERLPAATQSPYANNMPRTQRENELNQEDLRTAARSLSELVTLGSNSAYPTRLEVQRMVDHAPFVNESKVQEMIDHSPYPNEQRVKEIIGGYWATRWTLGAAIFAAVFGIIAAIAAVFPLIHH